MNFDSAREFCLRLPHATEEVQWEDHLLLKVGGKIFALFALEPPGPVLSVKTTPEQYAELVECEGFTPTSHNMWKYQWISLERYDVVRDDELRGMLQISYELIYAGLTKKKRAELEGTAPSPPARRKPAKKAAKPAARHGKSRKAKS